jgi:hypothetical protein
VTQAQARVHDPATMLAHDPATMLEQCVLPYLRAQKRSAIVEMERGGLAVAGGSS